MTGPSHSGSNDLIDEVKSTTIITTESETCHHASIAMREASGFKRINFLRGNSEIDVLKDATRMSSYARMARVAPEKFVSYAEQRFDATTAADILRAYIICQTCLDWLTANLELTDGDIQRINDL